VTGIDRAKHLLGKSTIDQWLKMKVNPATAGQADIDIARPLAEPRDAGARFGNHFAGFCHHGPLYAAARQRSDKAAVIGNCHVRARLSHGGA
jgi:hypothetical protein